MEHDFTFEARLNIRLLSKTRAMDYIIWVASLMAVDFFETVYSTM